MLCLQICVDADVDDTVVAKATRLAARYAKQLVAVELVRTRPPVLQGSTEDDEPTSNATGDAPIAEVVVVRPEPRLELLAVLVFPETDELEVHLAFDGRRIIGRSSVDDEVPSVVKATLAAIREFLPELPYTLDWARQLDDVGAATPLVAVALTDPEHTQARFGIATSERRAEATARATLHALNRSIALHLR